MAIFSSTRRCAAILPLALLAACSEQAESPGRDISAPVPVVVAPVSVEAEQTRLQAVGTSRAQRSIELFPESAGAVIAVHFRTGEFVQEGDLLVELERREEELAVALAEVKLEDARRLYDRYSRSAGSGAVLPTTIDAARTAVETARIELERARVALDERSIRAPFAGYVGMTDIDPGDRVGPDTLITSLDDRSALLVSFDVPEVMVGKIGVGDTVDIRAWKEATSQGSGTVTDMGSRIDPLNRTFAVRAIVDNGADRLRPGMSFRVLLDLQGSSYPVVAETAVQWGADGAYVWTVRDGRAERLPVGVVQRTQGRVLIDAALADDSLIVVEGLQRMRTGVDVAYTPPTMAASSESSGNAPAAGSD